VLNGFINTEKGYWWETRLPASGVSLSDWTYLKKMEIKDPKILGRAEKYAVQIKAWSSDLLKQCKSKDGWSFVKETGGVTLADSSTACMRGSGSVECPPRRLQMALEEVENTSKYDDACIEGKLVEQLCDNYENDLGVVVGYVQASALTPSFTPSDS